jgi:hypothetical protein
MKLSYFTSVKNTLGILQLCHFPVLLLVNSKNAVYDHVLAIWQGRIIDYESKNIYMLTNESLQQICGANTFFSHVSCGYGLFPPAKIQALSPEITNWRSTKRKFFNKKSNCHYGILMISTKGSTSINCHYRCIQLGNITVL